MAEGRGHTVQIRPPSVRVETVNVLKAAAAILVMVAAYIFRPAFGTPSPDLQSRQSAIGLLPAIAVWRWPSLVTWGWVVLIAFCGTFSHYCMTRALRHADATLVVPMDFLRVPLSALVGWLVYTEKIDLLTAVGAALILAGNMLNLKSGASRSPVPARLEADRPRS